MPAAVWIILGLAGLVVGAELIVRHGAKLAARLGVPSIIVGLTIVSLGTSAPELAVGIDAVRTGAGSLAVGNIAGTNVANLLLILGLSAAIRPLAIQRQTIRIDLPGMAIASLLLLALSLDGQLTVLDGIALVAVALVYIALLIRTARRRSRPSTSRSSRTVRRTRPATWSCDWCWWWRASRWSCSVPTGWSAVRWTQPRRSAFRTR